MHTYDCGCIVLEQRDNTHSCMSHLCPGIRYIYDCAYPASLNTRFIILSLPSFAHSTEDDVLPSTLCVPYQGYSSAHHPNGYHLSIQLHLTPTAASTEFQSTAMHFLQKFKTSKSDPTAGRASRQSGSPGSSRRSLRERFGWGSRTRSLSRAVEMRNITSDRSTTSQPQTTASVHGQPDGSYLETSILQMHGLYLVTF